MKKYTENIFNKSYYLNNENNNKHCNRYNCQYHSSIDSRCNKERLHIVNGICVNFSKSMNLNDIDVNAMFDNDKHIKQKHKNVVYFILFCLTGIVLYLFVNLITRKKPGGILSKQLGGKILHD